MTKATTRDTLELRPARWLRVFMAQQGMSQRGLASKAWPKMAESAARSRIKNAVLGRLRWTDEHWRPILRVLGKRGPELFEAIGESKAQRLITAAKQERGADSQADAPVD
jgi:hypothetical protein